MTALTDSISTPTFSEGSTVRHRATGRTYTVAHLPSVGDSTWIYLSEPSEDSSLAVFPNRELEAVEVARISNATIPAGFTLTSDDGEFLDADGPTYTQGDATLQCIWSSDKGHQFFLDRRTDEPLTPGELASLARLLKRTSSAFEMRKGAGQQFAEYVDMLDSTGEIQATISDDGLDVTIGYERDFTIGGENGPTTFPFDAAHVSEFIRLLQRVEAAL